MALLLRLFQDHFRTGESVDLRVDGYWFRLGGGKLYVDGDEERLRDLVGAHTDEAPNAEIDSLLAALATRLAGRPATPLDNDDGEASEPTTITGPFVAAPLVSALSLVGAVPAVLESRLGGTDQRLEVAVPAVDIGFLEPESIRLIERLHGRPTLGELLGDEIEERQAALSRTAALHALGVVVLVNEGASTEASAPTLADRLRDRVAERLEIEPLAIDSDDHRQLIAERFRELGDMDHYRFLEIEQGCDEAAVTAGFERVARWVHPCHARALGLAKDDAMLASLFNRAVEAFHTLIDPDRRIAYNRGLQSNTVPKIDDAQRMREKQALADEGMNQALHLLKNQEVSAAVDLLQQSVRLAPSGEAYAVLARALARNPAWRPRAVHAWLQAIELRRDWPQAHIALAELLETMEEEKKALEHYRRALSLDPGNGAVQVAIMRLGGEDAAPKTRRLPWQRS